MHVLLDKLAKVRNRHLLLIDALSLTASTLGLLAVINGESLLTHPMLTLSNIIGQQDLLPVLFLLGVSLGIFYLRGVYRVYWRYARLDDLMRLVSLVPMVMAAQFGVLTLYTEIMHGQQVQGNHLLGGRFALLNGLIGCCLMITMRLMLPWLDRQTQNLPPVNQGQRALIIGAGNAGTSLVRAMQKNPRLGFYPVAFLDDDAEKQGLEICGIPVLGDRSCLAQVILRSAIQRVVIAMPVAPGSVIRELADESSRLGIRTTSLPGIAELLSSNRRLDTSLREVQIEDLLRREPIETDTEQVFQLLRGKRILITGAGGSIGSELCRQILQCQPAAIMILGKGENSVFEIQQELLQLEKEQLIASLNPRERIQTFIADIRNIDRLDLAFKTIQPDAIFHAAAHKHVPLMEHHSPEAISSNIQGTWNLLKMAERYDVEHLVMISTDKAVRPTSVMGATKRVAEMLVLHTAKRLNKPYAVVRFGNVLGSRGSVIPTFKKQIARGGPITITHPEVNRFFMTIPEAVQLVLQAAVIGKGGEVMMLKMGAAVKIVDLAKDLIRLSGYEVDTEIPIVFTGLRPGEKLYEELFLPGEHYDPTEHEKILIARNASASLPKDLLLTVEALCRAARENDVITIQSRLQQLVLGYKPEKILEKPDRRISA
jgi:FlaA1/EpsC-like NDP-sugar epimerase